MLIASSGNGMSVNKVSFEFISNILLITRKNQGGGILLEQSHDLSSLLWIINEKPEVIFSKIKNSNHFFKNKEKELSVEIEKYLKEKTALI